MAENSKYFFRTDRLGTADEGYIDVPEDLDWAIDPSQTKPINRVAAGGSTAIGIDGADSNDNVDQGYTNPDHYPNTKIDTPVITSIVKQEVSQDPEGKATIDVTFGVTDLRQGAVEWELRITR